MITCEDCGKQLDYGGRGRPPKYCPVHAKASKRRLDRSRSNGGHKERMARKLPQCCLDAKLANQKAKKCDQHRQWRAWQRSAGEPGIYKPGVYVALKYRPDRTTPNHGSRIDDQEVYDEVTEQEKSLQKLDSNGFRVTTKNRLDFMIPDCHLEILYPSMTKYGYDQSLEAFTRAWLRRAERQALAA